MQYLPSILRFSGRIRSISSDLSCTVFLWLLNFPTVASRETQRQYATLEFQQ
ncbi:MAG: hypothetical protein J7641_21010 [Cyanobacteria bacterium SID2]|nr:hypothetical protein [Cyanobacteria bacterium SID2]MBP0006410.1 hypothetical protein [Cyanobacteria bacterium SBC]